MHQVKADTAKNRLYITMAGLMADDEVKQTADEVIEAVKKLQPGFAVVNDISALKPTTPEGTREIIRAQQFIQQSGVRKVIRVIADASVTGMQFKRTGNAAGYTQDANVAKSVQDADTLLDSKA